jgi:site-specific DNA recombinase
LFRIILKATLELGWKESAIKQNQITKNIEHLFDRSIKAKELLLKGEIEDEDFRIIKADCELKVNAIGKNLQQVAQQIITVQKELDKEATKISHIDKVYSDVLLK